jgi:hypothetical protein
MAKTTAPLLSFGGNGQIGKTQVYASWRGVKYARRYVVPANPNSTSQQRTRGVFNWIAQAWKLMDPAVQAVWTLGAKGRPFTDRNMFTSSNLSGLRGTDSVPATTLATLIASPGVNGGLVDGGHVGSDAGTHHLTVTLTAPTLPTGWTIAAAHAICWKQQDAHTGTDFQSYYATDVSAPYAPSIACPAAGTFEWCAFFQFLKPDGSTAYGPSTTGAQVLA